MTDLKVQRLIEEKDLRKVWSKEASDFTPWLADEDNIDILSEAIGIDIEIEERESPVGKYSLDILAREAGTDRVIIIENQIEDTDHDHLGKLITYASGKNANVIVWITKHANEEHRAAVEWLNNHTDDEIGFFLCEIKLYRIGDSEPAVKFDVIEKPNDWTKQIKKVESMNGNMQRRLEFWRAFNEHAYNNTQFARAFRPRKPSTDAWMDFSIGSSACHLAVNQIIKRGGELSVELYISEDKDLFHALYDHKGTIEEAFGHPLDWRELLDRKASRIIYTEKLNPEDRDKWADEFDWIVEHLLRMKKAFSKFL